MEASSRSELVRFASHSLLLFAQGAVYFASQETVAGWRIAREFATDSKKAQAVSCFDAMAVFIVVRIVRTWLDLKTLSLIIFAEDVSSRGQS